MAPEQAGGKRAHVGPATDIYALGVMLYQLLTGQLPFQGESTLEVLRAVTSDEPPRPRSLQPRVPRDLEAITLRCLEKEPGHRYSSALALAEDLERFHEGKPVLARPAGIAARLARACRRRPLIALLLALLATSFCGGLAGVSWKWLEADEQRMRASELAQQAVAEKQGALYETYQARLAAAGAALENNDVADAARQLEAAPKYLRDWEWRHLYSRLDDSSAIFPVPADEKGFLVSSPDGLRIGFITAAGHRLIELDGGDAGSVPIDRDYTDVRAATHTRRGLRVLVTRKTGGYDLLDERGQIVCQLDTPRRPWRPPMIVSPDGARAALVLERPQGDQFLVFDAGSGKRISLCEGHPGNWAILFSPDGTKLVSADDDGIVWLWNAATGAVAATCRGHQSKVVGAAFSPDGARLVTTSADCTVRQWDPATGRQIESPYDRHSGEVAAAVYSPDGKWIASAGVDRTIRVWQANGRQDVAVLHGHTAAIAELAFSPDGRRLASVSHPTKLVQSSDNTVRVWNVDPVASLPVLRGHTSYVYPVAFSPDGRWIASGAWDSKIGIWEAATGMPCAWLRQPGVVWGLAFAPDSSWIISTSHLDSKLRIWDVATGQLRREVQHPDASSRGLALSPDGATVAVTTKDEQKEWVCVLNVDSGDLLFRAEGASLAYSSDGRWLAALGVDRTSIILLDARTHKVGAEFEGHEGLIIGAAFSPDSRRLVSCSVDHTARLWDVPGGKCQVLDGHNDEVFAAAFHPDGTRLATAGRDRGIWMWDLATGKDVLRLQGHVSYVWALAFSPDGTTLASGSGDFTVRLWDTAPLKERYQVRRQAEALTPEAEQLVARLFAELREPVKVVSRLQSDQTLTEPLRRSALRAVMRRAQQFTP
jgi:WD40 repeat protein